VINLFVQDTLFLRKLILKIATLITYFVIMKLA